MSDELLALLIEEIKNLKRRVNHLERCEYVGKAGDADTVDGYHAEELGGSSDADTVDGFHASATAQANKLLALDASAKLPASITGDANTVDGFHASATANKLLALDASAKLPASITGDADTVDGFHASATATANKLLALDASAKLPASITGDADTVDGKHAGNSSGQVAVSNSTVCTNLNADMVDGYHASSLGGAEVTLYTASSSTQHSTTSTSFTDIPDVSCSVQVQSGDIVVAICHLTGWLDLARATAAAYCLAIGSAQSQPQIITEPGNAYPMPVALTFAATASSSTTWTVRPQFKSQESGRTAYSRYESLVVLRIRP